MTAFHENREVASLAAEKLKVFAQPLRLMILSCLLRGERNVGEIADSTGIGQPALSQQLAELRRANLVRTRREAKQVWYALADPGVELCVSNMEALLGSDGSAGLQPPLAPKGNDSKPGTPAPGVAGFARLV